MNITKKFITAAVLLACLVMALTSCYRMPEKGEYSVVPTTNNPAVFGGGNNQPNMMPGGGF